MAQGADLSAVLTGVPCFRILTDSCCGQAGLKQGDAGEVGMGSMTDLEITNGVLAKYRGPGGYVTIPEGIRSIGNGAFRECAGLTGVCIPESVTDIGSSAFYGCKDLLDVTIPEGVTEIREWTFAWCTNLRDIRLPAGLASIGESAFSECRSLRSVTLPEGLMSIGHGAFSDCESLETARVPGSTKDMGKAVFCRCQRLRDVTIPEGVTRIGNLMFCGCRSLGSVRIPESVTGIGDMAFNGCVRLTELSLPDSVASIGDYAFHGCDSLRAIRLPPGLKNLPKGRLGVHCVICYAPWMAAHAEHPIYLGGGLSDLPEEDRGRAVIGFMYAREFGIREIGRWEEEYLDCFRLHAASFMKAAKRSRTVLLFLVGQKIPDREETERFLDLYKDSDDVEVRAALLQYSYEMFGAGDPGDFPL